MALLVMLFGSIAALHAQSGFFVPPKAKIFFSGNTSTIFSNVTNQGQLGVGKNATVNFKGQQWENDPSALVTDESNNGNGTTGQGGMINFLVPDTSLPPLFNQQQLLIGGYNAATRIGASFPNLSIANPWGVKLLAASAKIRRQLDFTNGHLYVNDNILVVGDGRPGSITGYNENRFVVTGTSMDGGFLLREKLGSRDGMVVFPIGSAEGMYTPAAIHLHGSTPDDFYARVSDSVKTGLRDGQDLSDKSVNKTWQIGKLQRPGEDIVDIVLQHRLADEGKIFVANRDAAFIAQYAGGSWDAGYPQTRPQSGNITTGAPLPNSGTNTRVFHNTVSTASYFTKLTGSKDTSLNRTKLWFSAYRTDYRNVYVYWATNPEIGIKYFVVQRMLSNETVYSNRDTVLSNAPGGISFNYLNYNLNDPNGYTGVSYYRLMMVDYNGNITYSQIVAVGAEPGGFGWTLWPNPSPGRFFVGISTPSAVKYVVIWDIVGRLLYTELVNSRGLIEMHLHTSGTYVIGLVPMDGDKIQSKKLVIIGD